MKGVRATGLLGLCVFVSLGPKLAPRGAQIGFRGGWGARKSPQGGEEKRQEGAKMAQEGPQEAHLEALGADLGGKFGKNGVKMGAKMRK